MDEVAYELDIVERLDRLGWPVPVPVQPPSVVDGAVWCACKFLDGAPIERTHENQRMLGRLIANLQIDLATLGVTHQRAGWTRADAIFDLSPSPVETFRAWESRMPGEMRVLREFAERAQAQLAEYSCAKQPSVLVHGDLTPWNVHYTGDHLTGLFDFEMVHRDVVVAEFAHTWRGRYEGFIEGFEEVTPLNDTQRSLIAPVRWAWIVEGARQALIQTALDAHPPDLNWAMMQLARRSPLMRF